MYSLLWPSTYIVLAWQFGWLASLKMVLVLIRTGGAENQIDNEVDQIPGTLTRKTKDE